MAISVIPATIKKNKYEDIIENMQLIINNENNIVSKMANLTAMLKKGFNFVWVGFYLVDLKQKNQLVLGPFQGELAPFRINYNQGILGTAWSLGKTLVVSNIHEFADSTIIPLDANSQISLPIVNNENKIIAILNINSSHLDAFCEIDKLYLEKIIETFKA